MELLMEVMTVAVMASVAVLLGSVGTSAVQMVSVNLMQCSVLIFVMQHCVLQNAIAVLMGLLVGVMPVMPVVSAPA